MAKKLSEDEIKYVISAETAKAQKEIFNLSKATKELKREERERRNAMIELEAQGKKNTEEYKRMSKECKNYSQSISENEKKIDELRKKLDINVMSMTQLRKQSKDLRRELNNMSKAMEPERYSAVEKQLSKVSERMNELKVSAKSLVEIATSETALSTMAGMLSTKLAEFAGDALARMKEIAAEGIEMAEAADGVKRAFDRMDDGTILDNLRKATKGTVTDLDLMKAAVKAKDFRIPLEDLGKYLQFAQLKAQQTGQSVEYMTDSIVTGLGRKSPLILDNLGLSAAEINEQVSQTGDFMSAVASIVDKQLAAAGDNYVSSADRAQAASVRFKNAQLELGQTLLPLKENWDEIYTGVSVGTMELIGWIVKHRQALILLVTAYTAYTASQKIAIAWNAKHASSTLISVAAEKLQTLHLSLSKKAFLAKLIVLDLYRGRCNLATAATEMFNLVLKASPIGIVATLITTAAAAFMLFGNRADKTESSVANLNKRLYTEREELNNVFNELKKTNPGTNDRIRLVEELNNKYPGLITNYDLEKASLIEITKAQNEANAALTNRIATEMKAQATSDYVQKNISLQMNKIEYLMATANQRMGDEMYSKFSESINKVLNDSKTDLSTFWSTFGKYFNSTLGSDSMTGFRDAFYSLRIDQQNLADGIENINSKYEPYIKAIKTTVTLSDEELKKEVERTSLIKNLEKEKEKVQNTWMEDTKANIDLKNKELERLDAEIKKYKELGTTKKNSSNTESEKKKAEKEQLEAEKKSIADLETLRNQALADEERTNTNALNAHRLLLSEKRMTQQQYDIWEAAYMSNLADRRLSIEEEYARKIEALELKNGNLKEQAVKDAGKRVEQAEQQSFDARLKAEQVFRSNMDVLREMAKKTPTTPEAKLKAEYDTQLQLLEAFYQASLDYAKKHGQDETEVTELYNQAKLNLDKKYQDEKKKLAEKNSKELKSLQGNDISQQFTEIFNNIQKLQDAIENADFGGILQSVQAIVNSVLSGLSNAFDTFKQIEIDNVEAKYDAEIEAAQGNTEEVERLEQEKAQKKLDIEKKYADVQFAVKASQIVANTALAIMMALGQLGPIMGPIAAGLMAATGAVQLAAANAERQKVKNMTLSGSSSGKGTGARVATGRQSGGKIDVRRAQDNKIFPNANYDPDARGFIDHPTVIVGEGPSGQSKEWVASNAAVSNPTVAPILDILDQSQQAGTIRTLDLNQAMRARMAGYSSGGSIGTSVPAPSNPSGGSGSVLPPELMKRFANAIVRLDEEGLPPAPVLLSDIERKQELRNRSRAIGSKK